MLKINLSQDMLHRVIAPLYTNIILAHCVCSTVPYCRIQDDGGGGGGGVIFHDYISNRN